MCRASGVAAEIDVAAVPAISPDVLSLIENGCVPGGTRQNLETANDLTEWHTPDDARRLLLADAQTSGGLAALRAAEESARLFWQLLKAHRTLCAVVIGRIVQAARPGIEVF